MFNEEKCPYCTSSDYEILDYFEHGPDSSYMVKCSCECKNCHRKFEITYYYTLTQVHVEKEGE